MAKLTKTIITTIGKVKDLMVKALRRGYTTDMYIADGYVSVNVHKGSPNDKDYQSEAFAYYEYESIPDSADARKRRSDDFITKIKNYIEADEQMA